MPGIGVVYLQMPMMGELTLRLKDQTNFYKWYEEKTTCW